MTQHVLAGMVATLVLGAGVCGAAEPPRAEHPRPDMMRGAWMTLNGEWEFAETDDNEAEYLGDAAYPDRITVPFCRESALSGLGRTGFIRNVWYRRAFEVPADAEWSGKRVRLHVGACDWRTRVWVNGILQGTHTGGSAPFWFDVTGALKPGANTVVVHAFDDVRSGVQSSGKQSQKLESHGCVYTRTTGIWQPVWLEAVGGAFIEKLRVTPDVAGSRATVWARVDGAAPGMTLRASAAFGGKEMGCAEAALEGGQATLVVDLKEAHLWAAGDPNLYDLSLSVVRGDAVVDAMDSYFGLRSVTIEGRAILINGKPVFQRTVLDQGFYPDGIWTAPTDAALKADIEMSQAAGFNGARLHQKVFEPRFLHWADRLGYLVWGEFPNWGLNYKKPEVNAPVINEWRELLERDCNHPAIIGWCPFNETPAEAEFLQNTVVDLTRAVDPTRPVIDSSGWHHGHPNPIVMDAHDYNQDPATFKARWDAECGPDSYPAPRKDVPGTAIPFFVSEYGGIGWNVGEGAWGYGNNPKTLDEFYARHEGLTKALLDNRHMFGFCYTQLTDIEQEQNGIYTYDRKPKFDLARIKAVNSAPAAYEQNPPIGKETGMSITKEAYGTLPDGQAADLYTLSNRNGMKMRVTNYGGIVTELWVPDKNGAAADVALGYDSLEDYLKATPYFGAIVGRYGNRIAKGKFTLDGREHTLATNDGPNALHGGLKGFDKVLWAAEPVRRADAVGLQLKRTSPDGEEGYPGNLTLTVTYWLTAANELEIEYAAVTDAPTVLNPTFHGYFNLRGHNNGDILGHEMMLNAGRFTPVDKTLIPTGVLQPVAGTPFDFTKPFAIGARVNGDHEQLKFGLGYDHNFVLDRTAGGLSLAARVREPESGRVMEVWTTEPGIQFYCGNFLDGTNVGKGGHAYQYRTGFCLETQHFPNSPNQPDFPPVVLRPGETYTQHTVYRFMTD